MLPDIANFNQVLSKHLNGIVLDKLIFLALNISHEPEKTNI
jgi:hypothetical protein